MFGSDKQDDKNVGTVISQETIIEGEIEVEESIRIDGQLNGTLTAEGDVFIGQEGRLTADIKAENVMIAGSVEGNVVVDDKLEVVSTGRLSGDISISNLVIHDGGVFEGSSTANLDRSQLASDEEQEAVIDLPDEEQVNEG
ncbi:polymer-forming cytoskeletal protein [Halanaerobaculum tunisiense]